jgi:hypothetical protein
MTTIPGILTAIGAVITAAVPIKLGTHKDAPSPTPSARPAAMRINLAVSGSTPPSDATNIDQQSLRLDNMSAGSSRLGGADPVEQLIDQCSHGDETACIEVLDALAQDCAHGSGLGCDVLYEVSPIGSDYEAYGATYLWWTASRGLRRHLQRAMTRLRDAYPPRVESFPRRYAARLGRAATEQPLPWLVAALVFVANATLSTIRGDWLLGLEMGTGLLAGLSAVAVASRRSAAAADSTTGNRLPVVSEGARAPHVFGDSGKARE